MIASKAEKPCDNRREYDRTRTALKGKLFLPVESHTVDCMIVDLSAGGAGVMCEDPPPLECFVVLYVDGFGRYDAVTTRYVEGVLGLRFVCRDAKRQRLIEMLEAYISGGDFAVTRLRRHARAPSAATGYFIRANGEHVACDVLDISLQGVSLGTTARPPIGETVNLGKTHGWVVRHHERGIGIQFLSPGMSPGSEDRVHGC